MPNLNQPAPERTESERRSRMFVVAFAVFIVAFAGLVGFSRWREVNQMAADSQANEAGATTAPGTAPDE